MAIRAFFGVAALLMAASSEAASPTKFRGFCTETAFALLDACYASFTAGSTPTPWSS